MNCRLYDLDGAIFRDNDPPERGGVSGSLDELRENSDGIYWRRIRGWRLSHLRIELTFKGWVPPEDHFIEIIIDRYKKLGRDLIPRIAKIKLYEAAQN